MHLYDEPRGHAPVDGRQIPLEPGVLIRPLSHVVLGA